MTVMLRIAGMIGVAIAFAVHQPSVMAQEVNESQVEELLDNQAKSMEDWAEKHSADWEEWAEMFEAKMEAWGKEQEVIWEKWAESYSAEWEQWGDKLESGELKEADIKKLLDRNLSMLSDMPLAELVDGLLQDGLQELKNAPWDSLHELQDLVGGSIEKSLEAIEKETADLNAEHGHHAEHAHEVHEALHKLHHYLESKSKKLGAQSKQIEQETIQKLKALEQVGKNGVDPELEAKILAALEKEMKLREKDIQSEHVKKAIFAREKAKAAYQKAMKDAEKAKQQAKVQKEKEAKQKAAERSKKKPRDTMSQSVAEFYKQLRTQKMELDEKNSEIDKMRKEIDALRRAVEELRKERR